MKTDIDTLRDSFQVGYYAYEQSRKEANEVWDLYHNRQFTQEQLAILSNRGQPAETFNVIKMFARMLLGYYSTVVNTMTATPRLAQHIDNAALMSDTLKYITEDNRFDIIGDQMKLSGLLSGLICSFTNVVDTGNRDNFGRPVLETLVDYVPDSEIVLDNMSRKDDYSDARFIHRFKWMPKETVVKLFGKDAPEKLDAYHNYLNADEADYEFNYGEEFTGHFRVFDNYLITHTVVEDDNGKSWSVYWSGDVELKRDEVTFKKTRWPYRVQRIHSSDYTEYYGIFREVIEPQRAINQAVIKLQLLANSEKAYVEDGAVENIDDFTNAFNRVNGVIEVLKLNGIKVETSNREIQEQYIIIDKALERIQKVLGITDSFLGTAFASDSGRKVKLQQNQTVMSLRYITARIESFYRSLGQDMANLVTQYYTANQILAVTDEIVGQRWVELNKPMVKFSGQFDEFGQPMMEPILLPVEDPASGELVTDEEGNFILAPVNEITSEFAGLEFQIKIEANSYNDEDEKAQLLLETVMSGQVGQMTAQINPAGFFQMASLSLRSMKTKYSPNIAEILNQTAQMLGQDPAQQAQASVIAQGNGGPGGQPMSRGLKLPQNTNEEAI